MRVGCLLPMCLTCLCSLALWFALTLECQWGGGGVFRLHTHVLALLCAPLLLL